MSNTLLGFGLACFAAAIIGGGLKAFGFEIPVLKSTSRQIMLGILGLALIVSAEWDKIRLPVGSLTETKGPLTLETGQSVRFPLSLNHGGKVVVTVADLKPDWNGFAGQRGQPGQDGVYVSICTAESGCSNRQMAQSDSFSQELPPSPGTISVFNFASSPRMSVTLIIKHPT